MRPDAMCGDRALQQRITIRRGLGHDLGGNLPAAAAAVIHHKGLT